MLDLTFWTPSSQGLPSAPRGRRSSRGRAGSRHGGEAGGQTPGALSGKRHGAPVSAAPAHGNAGPGAHGGYRPPPLRGEGTRASRSDRFRDADTYNGRSQPPGPPPANAHRSPAHGIYC